MRHYKRWLALQAIIAAALALLYVNFGDKIHGAEWVAFPLILLLYARGAYQALRLALTIDMDGGDVITDHDLEVLVDVSEECQYAGMLCMIGGFFIILSAHFSDSTALLHAVETGAPLALGGTFLGVLMSRILAFQHRLFYREVR